MNNKFLRYMILLMLLIVVMLVSCAPDAYLSDSRTDKVGINSEELGIFMTVEIHIPRGYNDEDSFPVLYLLHDYARDESSIRQAGFFMMADILTEQGLIDPMLIVSPQINNSYLLNSSDETIIYGEDGITGLYSGMFEDYFTKEVIMYVEETYNASTDPGKRFIGGISTGGYAALRMAFTNPEMFSKVGAHMPALWTPRMEMMEMDLLGWYYPDDNTKKSRNPVEIAYNNSLDGLSIFIDCGDKDWYSKPFAEELVDVLDKKNYNFDFEIFEGKHDIEYISEHVTDYLMFYGGN